MNDGVPEIPPAKYWTISPTYNQWCKLSIFDIVHRLRTCPGFEGQNVLFYQNHPVRFIYLVALIVSITTLSDDVAVITLDDSSGACIDAIVRRDANHNDPLATKAEGITRGITADSTNLYLDKKLLVVGHVVKAKGTFTSFRDIRQVELRRVFLIQDTMEEMEAWNAAAAFKRDILLRPWKVSEEERELIDKRLKKEDSQSKLNKARHALSQKKHARRSEKQRQKEIEEEASRVILEREMNSGALI